MKFIAISCLLSACVLSLTQALNPFYGWSSKNAHGVENKNEIIDQVSSNQVALELKAILDQDKAFSAVLYIRPTINATTLAE
jgi:hypothetical protein